MRRLKGQGTTIICIYRNALVFLAADKTRLQGLDEAARRYLAWESIISEKDTRGISGYQAKQAEAHKAGANSDVMARLPETYQWLLFRCNPRRRLQWNDRFCGLPDKTRWRKEQARPRVRR